MSLTLGVVIRSFRSKTLQKFAATGNGSKLPVPAHTHDRVRRQLAALNAAVKPEDMNLPGWRFHGLEGAPKRYAVDVNGNYRVTWGWDDPDAINVDLEDHH
jgi:toxin HigB-1